MWFQCREGTREIAAEDADVIETVPALYGY